MRANDNLASDGNVGMSRGNKNRPYKQQYDEEEMGLDFVAARTQNKDKELRGSFAHGQGKGERLNQFLNRDRGFS